MFEFLKRLIFRKKDQESKVALDDPLKEPEKKWFNFSFFKKSKQGQAQPNKYNFNPSEDAELAELFHDEPPKAKTKSKSITSQLIDAVKSTGGGAKSKRGKKEGTKMTSRKKPKKSQPLEKYDGPTIDF